MPSVSKLGIDVHKKPTLRCGTKVTVTPVVFVGDVTKVKKNAA